MDDGIKVDDFYFVSSSIIIHLRLFPSI